MYTPRPLQAALLRHCYQMGARAMDEREGGRESEREREGEREVGSEHDIKK